MNGIRVTAQNGSYTNANTGGHPAFLTASTHSRIDSIVDSEISGSVLK
jgi:hypothetical protein